METKQRLLRTTTMRKSDLLRPGEYAGTPLAILARKDLTPAAKNVYTALASHLNNGNAWIWPSVARLAAMTASSQTTVRAAIRMLADAPLIELDRRDGKVTRYRFLDPTPSETDGVDASTPSETDGVDAPTPSETDGVDAPTPSETDGANNADPTNFRGGPHQFSRGTPPISGGEPLKEPLKEPSPPTPPQAGGCEGGGFSPKGKTKTRAEVVAQAEAAHVEAFGKPLPAKWKSDIRTEYNDGDRTALERIDAAILLQADVYRAAKQWSCLGHGTVMQYLAHVDRKANTTKKQTAKAQKQTAKIAETQKAEQQRRDDEDNARTAHFAALPPDQQDAYRRKAGEGRFAPKQPEFLERVAGVMAWNDHQAVTA